MIHFGPRHNYYYTMYDQLLWETINVVCHAHDEARVLLIDDSTPVSQSRHTLRFQPIACRSIKVRSVSYTHLTLPTIDDV